MINRFGILRNVGQFDSVTIPATVQHNRLTVVYAENGRGKTTLTAILRSFATGDPLPIKERRRLGASHPPHVVIHCTAAPQAAIFENDAWSRTRPNIDVFDDAFINDNIYSGLSVDPEHRQNLHELIIGAQGVTLNQQLQYLVAQVEDHNRNLRARADAIPAAERGGYSVDDFCALPVTNDIDARIEAAERSLAAAREQDPVREQGYFQQLQLPRIDVTTINQILQRSLPDLDATAEARVQAHIAGLAANGESWISDGINLMPEQPEGAASLCPFCAQDLTNSPVLSYYRAYFSDAYTGLKRQVNTAITEVTRTYNDTPILTLERNMRVNGERREFWTRFCNVPDITLDTAQISTLWQAISGAIVTALREKQAAPLEHMQLAPDVADMLLDFEGFRNAIQELNVQFEVANEAIGTVKADAASANPTVLSTALASLRVGKARHTPQIAALCDTYAAEKVAKAATEVLRDQARVNLDAYRTGVFPTYQTAINRYLRLFNAGFHIDNVQPVNNRVGSSCTYNVMINNSPVSVAGRTPVAGDHGFHNTLSAGDRNALALAFFFASLDQCPNLASKIVVIDDPFSSLDEHRCLTTIQEMRRLSNRAAQVIVLSHNKPFLCTLWEGTDRTLRYALQVVRQGTGSTLQEWDVNQDSVTEHDRRHALLRSYVEGAALNKREVAIAIRPLLESFLRVACPEYFMPGTLLGPFRGLCEQRVGTPDQIFDQNHIDQLRDLTEYGNRFHHDTNAAWMTEAINDGELMGYVTRALVFATK